MDFHQEKHRKASIALIVSGLIMLMILGAVASVGVSFLAKKVIQSRNQSLISPPEIVNFNLEKAEEVAH